MTTITGFSNTKCTLPAFHNLEMLRQPEQTPWLDNMRLLTFVPEPFALPKETKEAVTQYNKILGDTYVKTSYLTPPVTKCVAAVINQLVRINELFKFISVPENQKHLRKYQRIIAEPNTQMAIKMNSRAIQEVSDGRTVPYFAAYFDALKKPEQSAERAAETTVEEKLAPKAKYVSISERVAKRNAIIEQKSQEKASKRTMKLYKKQNKGKISLAEHEATIRKIFTPSEPTRMKNFALKAQKFAKSVLAKAAMII